MSFALRENDEELGEIDTGPQFEHLRGKIAQEKNRFLQALEKIVHSHRIEQEQILSKKKELYSRVEKFSASEKESEKRLYRILQQKNSLREELARNIKAISQARTIQTSQAEKVLASKRELLRENSAEAHEQERRAREELLQAQMLPRREKL